MVLITGGMTAPNEGVSETELFVPDGGIAPCSLQGQPMRYHTADGSDGTMICGGLNPAGQYFPMCLSLVDGQFGVGQFLATSRVDHVSWTGANGEIVLISGAGGAANTVEVVRPDGTQVHDFSHEPLM